MIVRSDVVDPSRIMTVEGMIPDDSFIKELIEDEDIIFNKDSEYHKQKKKEKKNPIFKRNKSKNRWAL